MDNRQPRPEVPVPKSTDAIDHQIILLHLLPHDRQHFAVSKVNKLSTLAPQTSTLFHSIEILGTVQSQDRYSREPYSQESFYSRTTVPGKLFSPRYHSISGQWFEYRHRVSMAHNPSWEINSSFTYRCTNAQGSGRPGHLVLLVPQTCKCHEVWISTLPGLHFFWFIIRQQWHNIISWQSDTHTTCTHFTSYFLVPQ